MNNRIKTSPALTSMILPTNNVVEIIYNKDMIINR